MSIFNSAKGRIKKLTGRHALVDGIPYVLPVNSTNSPALMSLYSIDAVKAKKYLPGEELHPLLLLNGRGVLVLTVIDYRETDIGKYIEYSIAIGCTHGLTPAPRLLPALFMNSFNTGQCVMDLPVSSEISVKGGRGIWGMPKHKQTLNYIIGNETVSAQYDLDGKLALKIVIPKPASVWLPLSFSAANYCAFRGMLMKSYIYFKTRLGFTLGTKNKVHAKFIIGDHPRVQWLKDLDIAESPFITAFLPSFEGNLDDHFECWFLTSKDKITHTPEGLEMTYPLGYSEDWPSAPIDTGTMHTNSPSNSFSSSAGITFSETMAGGFSLGETSPQQGAAKGRNFGCFLEMHVDITIEDIDKFIADPNHQGSILGKINFTPFGAGISSNSGKFNLFSSAGSPEIKYMVYELGFTHEGAEYYLAGRKEVKDENGFDLWSDTTTLYTCLYIGNSAEGVQIGAGILSLGIKDLAAMIKTFRVLNSTSKINSFETLNKFGKFFMGELWDSYFPK